MQFCEKYFIDGIVHKSKVIQDLDEYNFKMLAVEVFGRENFIADIAW